MFESLWSALQPIVDLKTGEIIGHEALIRGPSGSDLAMPQQIFQYGADHGQERELEELCRSLGLSAGQRLPEGQRLFVNVDTRHEGLPIVPMGDEGPARPLAIEILERGELMGNAAALKSIQAWRAAGYAIVLDDYGAGYASLGSFLALQPDMIKIDRYVVNGLDADHRRMRAVEKMVALANETNTAVIAEGVETLGELRVLRALGVGYGQGFLFGKPERDPQKASCPIVVAEGPVKSAVVPMAPTPLDRAHDAFYDTLFDDKNEGVYFVDKRRTILKWNKTAEELTGFKPRDVVGRKCMSHILDHTSEDGIPLCNGLCPLVHAMADGRERYDVVFMRNKAGERKRVHIRAIPVWGDDGRVVGAIEKFRLAEVAWQEEEGCG